MSVYSSLSPVVSQWWRLGSSVHALSTSSPLLNLFHRDFLPPPLQSNYSYSDHQWPPYCKKQMTNFISDLHLHEHSISYAGFYSSTWNSFFPWVPGSYILPVSSYLSGCSPSVPLLGTFWPSWSLNIGSSRVQSLRYFLYIVYNPYIVDNSLYCLQSCPTKLMDLNTIYLLKTPKFISLT